MISDVKVLSSGHAEGEKVLVVVSSVSLAAVVALLVIIITAAFKTTTSRKPGPGSGIFRSHVTAYFVSLLVSDLFQAVGSLMNSKWVRDMAVRPGGFCFAQGLIKQVADVGTAFWITTIAIHTFNILVLGIHIPRILMYLVLIGGWSYIGIIVAMGPFILQTPGRGSFFNISGYWCWISDAYPVEQIVYVISLRKKKQSVLFGVWVLRLHVKPLTLASEHIQYPSLDYMMMFLAAAISSVLYLLVFLKLRGNLVMLPKGRLDSDSDSDSDSSRMDRDSQSEETADLRVHIVSVTKHMLLYPTAYIILIVPIAACRVAEWMGHDVPFRVVIFSDSVFLLSGFVNASLFVFTGRVLPVREILNMFQPQ